MPSPATSRAVLSNRSIAKLSNCGTRISARQLAHEWGLEVRHALYHHAGYWYHVLKEFPAALLDPHGYVRFPTEAAYRRERHLRHGKHLHVDGGIHALPGYRRVATPSAPAAIDLTPARRAAGTAYRILRDTNLTLRVKVKCAFECQLCGLSLTLPDGSRYTEAHHVQPLGSPHDGPDIEANVLCVCPNHHAALDFGAIQLKRADLRTPACDMINDRFIAYHNTNVYGKVRRRVVVSSRGGHP